VRIHPLKSQYWADTFAGFVVGSLWLHGQSPGLPNPLQLET